MFRLDIAPMLGDCRLMKFVVAAVLVAAVAACTKPNPRSCLDGVCDNSEYPFCDVNGTLGGVENECIAVTCEARAFAECRDDRAVTCNANGNDYVISPCSRGCDAGFGGCVLCAANETTCTAGVLATCNAAGELEASVACSLGCEEERCRELVPSNDLGVYFSMADDPKDVTLDNGEVIDTRSGTIDGVVVPSFLVPAPTGGSEIRVLVFNRVRLGSVNVRATGSDPAPALAILALEDVVVTGPVTFSASSTSAGGMSDATCEGGLPLSYLIDNHVESSGGGGGGFATIGGNGGVTRADLADMRPLGGGISGDPALTPLRGGCAGTKTRTAGGGALQLSSRSSILVSGVIDVRGAAGAALSDLDSTNMPYWVSLGGGAGGGILLEAPSVALATTARLLATGGSGASKDNPGSVSTDGSVVSGGSCNATFDCRAGGASAGALPNILAATAGGDLAQCTQSCAAGGGGGGLGRIRINTSDGAVLRAVGSIEAGVSTPGVVGTR